ncbi:MFS transporter [uncultured Gilliamella sp.]|uniref:MFS transporter n=1 Tax=uncultured Gilliamella sp. TaxID=1193505 RepID=UPI0025CF787D|nr:MFS transporter [uncultured Gilliamella sp.]
MNVFLGDAMHNEKIAKSASLISLSLIPFTALCVVTLLYIFLPVAINLASFLSVSQESVAQLTTCFGIFYAFGFLVWGALSDKFGRENIIQGGLLSLAIITFILPLYQNYGYLLLMRCLQGFFASSFPPVILAWLAENLEEKYRKCAVSLISCAFLLAGSLGQWFGSVMIETAINLSMYILGIIYVLSSVIFYFLSKKIIKNSVNQINQSPKKVSLIKTLCQIPNVLFDRKLIRIYGSALFVLMSFVALYLFINSFNSDISISVAQLRQIATLGMLVSLLSSWLFSKIAVTKILAISLMMMSITFAVHFLIIYRFISTNSLLPLVHLIYVSSIALAIPSMITCSSLFSTPKNRGVAVSLYTCILFIGASLGSLFPNYINMNFLVLFITAMLFIIGVSVAKLKQSISS